MLKASKLLLWSELLRLSDEVIRYLTLKVKEIPSTLEEETPTVEEAD